MALTLSYPGPKLNDLPVELKTFIVEFLPIKRDVSRLSRVNNSFNALALPRLYTEVTLPIPQDDRAVEQLVKDIAAPGLLQYTTSLSIVDCCSTKISSTRTYSNQYLAEPLYDKDGSVVSRQRRRFWQFAENFSSMLKFLFLSLSNSRRLRSFRYSHRLPLGKAAGKRLFHSHHSTLESITVDEGADAAWIEPTMHYPLPRLREFSCRYSRSTAVSSTILKAFFQSMLQQLYSLRIGNLIGQISRELLAIQVLPPLQSLELIQIPVNVTGVPNMLGALQLLAILSCPHAEELFRTLSTAYAQMSGRNWLPRLRELSYQSEGQASTKLKDFKNFVSAFSGLELISVLYESRTMRDSRNTLLKQIIESHGATLKILVWQLRSCNGDMDGCGGREHFPLQDNLFEYIYTRCQLLEEISVVVDWPGRYHTDVHFLEKSNLATVHSKMSQQSMMERQSKVVIQAS